MSLTLPRRQISVSIHCVYPSNRKSGLAEFPPSVLPLWNQEFFDTRGRNVDICCFGGSLLFFFKEWTNFKRFQSATHMASSFSSLTNSFLANLYCSLKIQASLSIRLHQSGNFGHIFLLK